jgi:hypothetical protein
MSRVITVLPEQTKVNARRTRTKQEVERHDVTMYIENPKETKKT